jgi:glycerophosphoryl diester phosphodiesterase
MVAALAARPQEARRRRILRAPEPLVIAHRGASRMAPENSLAAFDAAIASGADAVELDVRRTGDGVLVVHHAAQRRRIPVSAMTYAELAHRSRHRPARLEEVLQLCAGRIAMDVEIKQAGCEPEVLELLAQRFPLSELLITSFQESVVTTVKRLAPQALAGLIVGPAWLHARSRHFGALPFELASRCGADLLVLHRLLLPHRRRRPRSQGVLDLPGQDHPPILVWTVNSPVRLVDYLSDAWVAGIITDLPDVAVRTRRRLGLQP